MNKLTFYFVWGTASGMPKKRHTAICEAQAEAKRLASLNPGQEFIVLKAVSGHKLNPNPVMQFNYGNIGLEVEINAF